jgi:hypothetical protein
VRFSRIRFLGGIRFRASDEFSANTRGACGTSVMRGLAIPSFWIARLNTAQVRLLRLPPRRLSYLNAALTAA